MRLESGPGRVDMLRFGLVALAILFWAGLAFKDWKYGWREANRAKAREVLAPRIGAANVPKGDLGEHPTQTDFDMVNATNPRTLEEITNKWGQAEHTHMPPGGDIAEHWWVSDFGVAAAKAVGDQVVPNSLTYTKWEHSPSDVQAQLYWGIGAGLVGLYLLWLALKAAMMRVRIDDAGMKYGGTFIPFEAMTKLTNYRKKGLCTLHYKDAAGEAKQLRLDSWAVAKFEPIIDEICKAKGWPDPRLEAAAAAAPSEKSGV